MSRGQSLNGRTAKEVLSWLSRGLCCLTVKTVKHLVTLCMPTLLTQEETDGGLHSHKMRGEKPLLALKV